MTLGLLLTSVLLGMRHGIDWDHIAAISDLTSNSSSRRRGIALSGLYAGGHALVVFLLGANDQPLVHAASATNRASPSRLRCL